MNLGYAKYLQLPIKHLEEPRSLFNVDGTTNKSGTLQYYTDLQVQTSSQRTNLRFFLTDLGENKAILGYPWFAAHQKKSTFLTTSYYILLHLIPLILGVRKE